jgi:hypothetical protein
MILDCSGQPVERMDGAYWTDRGTKGELVLDHYHPQLVGDHAAARRLRSG